MNDVLNIHDAKAIEQNVKESNTDVLIAGNNVTIQSLDGSPSVLNNASAIQGNRTVVITMDEINNGTKVFGSKQAAISAGELLYLKADIINNNSGIIAATGEDSLVSITAREINNTTNSQKEQHLIETISKNIFDQENYGKVVYEYAPDVKTHIGTTALIGGAGNLSINTTGDMNLKGSAIFANKDINLDIGGDLNSVVVEDYTRTYTRTQEDGGMFGDDETREEETIKIRNISSYITLESFGKIK
ncbi:MAG: hemagglutinin repeat-containing protein [Elusimicrobiota bacterium]|jgi:hypothetical protein|nr:hemagglutinin repeat-containing protein [Elusimicrobiota bacterium]